MTPKRTSAVDLRTAAAAAVVGAAGPGNAATGSATVTLHPAMRVAIVTMDSHLASAAGRAHRALERRFPGLQLTVHAAAEWGGDTTALQRCLDDIARADIVVATMLFMEDHFLPVLPALQARREHCDAMVCAMSAAEVMKLTRMGRFSMDAPAKGPPGTAEAPAWEKQRSSPKPRTTTAAAAPLPARSR